MKETDIWCFKHEPQSFDEMVLNEETRKVLSNALINIPNMTLSGPAGVGKGTFTHILLRQTGLDYIWINGSDETSVDNMRTKVKAFATSLGVTPLKVVVINEADYLSPAAQAMLRDLIEQVHKITRFILMCNYEHKIVVKEVKSRCPVIEINNPPMKDVAKRVVSILNAEGVQIEKMENVVDIIKKLYPDMREILNTLQLNVHDNKIDIIKMSNKNDIYKQILSAAKNSDLDDIRKILRSNTINYTELYQYFFNNAGTMKSPGDAIIEIGDGLYRDGLIAIKEINFIRCVLRLIKLGYL